MAIHEVKYPRTCPSSSNDEISAPRNKMLSQYITAADVFFFFVLSCVMMWQKSSLVQYAYLRNSMHYVFFCLQFHRETRLLGNWCTVHKPCKLRLKDAADINFNADNCHLHIFVFSNIQWVELSSQTHIGVVLTHTHPLYILLLHQWLSTWPLLSFSRTNYVIDRVYKWTYTSWNSQYDMRDTVKSTNA